MNLEWTKISFNYDISLSHRKFYGKENLWKSPMIG